MSDQERSDWRDLAYYTALTVIIFFILIPYLP